MAMLANSSTLTARLIRISGSLGAVVLAYYLYVFGIVPMVEPVASSRKDDLHVDVVDDDVAREAPEHFKKWFGQNPNAWELKNPKILQNEQGMLLLNEYQTLGDGRVKIKPCTMVLLPSGEFETQADRRRAAVIMQAPAGAILEFKPAFDLRRGEVGRLVGGQLLGDVTIRSDQKLPGPEDDLFISTYDVELSETTVATPHPLEFRWGPNHGQGRNLVIELKPDPSKREQGPSVSGINSLEILYDVSMHAIIGHEATTGRMNRSPENAADSLFAGSSSDGELTPVTVTCQGPFRFDLIEHQATFRDHVDVRRMNPDGASDQLTCELLSFYFEEEARPGAKPGASPKLKPRRIEALGRPVILTSPAQNATARGERLEYDLTTRRVSLEAEKTVYFKQNENEIEARQLHYKPDETEGRLGSFLGVGPGWLVWHLEDESEPGEPRKFEANWTRHLRSRPHEGYEVISLEGSARAQVTGMGSLTSEEIHAWLKPNPIPKPPAAASSPVAGLPQEKPKREFDWVPDRMLARENVVMSSAEAEGKADRLEIWFTVLAPNQTPQAAVAAHVPGNSASSPGVSVPVTGAGGDTPWRSSVPGNPQRAPSTQYVSNQMPAIPNQVPPSGRAGTAPRIAAPPENHLGGMAGPAPPRKREQHFGISGKLIQAQVTLRDREGELSRLVVTGSARVVETQTARPDERPLVVEGDLLNVTQTSPLDTAISVTGKPAHVQGRGLTLNGSTVNVNRATNQVWIDGKGQMVILVDRDLEGNILPAPTPLSVTWLGRMNFDGKLARFEETVQVVREQQKLQTETLEVTLDQKIDFAEAKISQRPEIERIECREGVTLESRQFDPRGLKSIARLQTRDLSLHQKTGAITGSGPGWLEQVGRGNPDGITVPGQAAAAAASPETEDNGLNYLRVTFQQAMTGNMHRRQMIFSDDVESVYGPVENWNQQLDPDRPQQLGERGIVMNCRELTVNQMPATTPTGKPSIEMRTEGNTLVEGQAFTAKATRMTYTDAKQLLVLEGEQRTSAELWRQPKVGGRASKLVARKILYWRDSNRVEINGAKEFDLTQIPTERPDARRRAARQATAALKPRPMNHANHNQFRQACDLLREAERVVIFSGAGISAESGIPTFRDAEGLWQRFPPEQFATWSGLIQSALLRPGQLAEFVYEVLWPIASAEPNAGHLAVAQLQQHTRVSVITQNIDALHQAAGSREVHEIHGSIFETVSLRGTRRRVLRREELRTMAQALQRAQHGLFRRTRLALVLNRLLGIDWRGLHRPRLVLFGDTLAEPDWSAAQAVTAACDLFIQVGCSGQVFPAANLPLMANQQGTPVISISLDVESGHLQLRGTAAQVLPLLVAETFE